MIQKRLEILKSGTWVKIELFFDTGIKYNNVINKMANTTERSLSHSNTFTIPWTRQNIDALDLNTFNVTSLANALNEKYEAKYYVDNELLQQGFIVINNMNNGVPSLNFIDTALSLTEIWGSTTYKEFLEDDVVLSNVSSAYITAIDEMRNYSMDKTAVLSILSDVSGESFPVAYFPNNINVIGDRFNVDSSEVRADDSFNPYQTRPVFNAQAFLNMITEAYGYTLIKNASVDWDTMELTAISAESLDQGELDNSTVGGTYDLVEESEAHYYNQVILVYEAQVAMLFPESVGLIPNDITGFPASPTGLQPGATFFTRRTLFAPTFGGGNVGTINFTGEVVSDYQPTNIYIVYYDTTAVNTYIIESAVIETNDSTTTVLDMTINKVQFNTPTDPNAGAVLGLYVLPFQSPVVLDTYSMYNMVVTEEVLAGEVVTYDDSGQFEQDNVDLTYAAPTKTIKDILNGILQRFGALVDIDTINKEVEIFTYEAYGTRRVAGDFVDWSDYHQEYAYPSYNTNYGNNYAIKNKIGLSNPYLGNSVEKFIGNQVTDSKYKEFATDYNTQFADITSLVTVVGTLNTHSEFSISGAAMIEFQADSGSYQQRRFDNTTQGTSTGLSGMPFLQNVNYSELPEGQDQWYTLIDSSIRCTPTFLLPQNVIRYLDIKKPVYINHLGGFYIIEEIIAYDDVTVPVRVKLIKLPSEWGL